MRHYIPIAAILGILVGCDRVPTAQPTTGKEFLDKFQRAERDHNENAMWRLLAAESKQARIVAARKDLEKAMTDRGTADKLRAEYELGDKEIQKIDPEELAQKQLKKDLHRPSMLTRARYVDEKSEGGKVTLIVDVEGQGQKEIPLVKEGEDVHIRWDGKNDF